MPRYDEEEEEEAGDAVIAISTKQMMTIIRFGGYLIVIGILMWFAIGIYNSFFKPHASSSSKYDRSTSTYSSVPSPSNRSGGSSSAPDRSAEEGLAAAAFHKTTAALRSVFAGGVPPPPPLLRRTASR